MVRRIPISRAGWVVPGFAGGKYIMMKIHDTRAGWVHLGLLMYEAAVLSLVVDHH